MTDHPLTDNNHPITPPPELVEQWATEHLGEPVRITDRHSGHYIAAKAADWKLEQVIEWLEGYKDSLLEFHILTFPPADKLIEDLKKAMRPQEDNS